MTPGALRRLGRWLRRRSGADTGHSAGHPNGDAEVTVADTGQSPEQVRGYWTSERMAAARPRDQHRDR